ncbi:hypothetical protein [Brevibacterium daeguense]|nr:hypothetical protein [Brevibacterium daeguense]
MSTAENSRSAGTPRADTVIIASAVALSLIGLLALVIVVIAGVSGSTPSVTLTWIGMLTIPAAFILLVVEFGRAIARRRA